MMLRKKTTEPFLEVEDVRTLAGIINRFAAFFDAKKLLSPAEASVLFVLLAHMAGVLLDAFPNELQQLVSMVEQMKDEDPDPTKCN